MEPSASFNALATYKGNWNQFDLAEERAPDFLALDEALTKLAAFDERKGKAIELKFFGGMTTEEIGEVLGISVATVGRELRLGQAWLRREMSHNSRES